MPGKRVERGNFGQARPTRNWIRMRSTFITTLMKNTLAQLKKQAKDLLKAHKSADLDAARRIKSLLSKYSARSEQEILDVPFSLREAQQIIAREHGICRSYRTLRIDRNTLSALPVLLVNLNQPRLLPIISSDVVSEVQPPLLVDHPAPRHRPPSQRGEARQSALIPGFQIVLV